MTPRWVRALHLAAGLAVGGCSIPDDFVGRAVSYNRSLEAAENETLLLNLLRAANERPLYFTNFSAIRGSMSAAVGAAAVGSVGWESSNTTTLGASLAPSAAIENSPSFDLAVQDTQAFARGVLTPIDNNVLDVFYQQDRDMKRLLDLFVSRIDLVIRPEGDDERADRYIASFWNDPFFTADASGVELMSGPELHEFGRTGFRCVRTVLADAGLQLRQAEPLEPTDVAIPASQLGDAEAIANALKAGVRFRRDDARGPVQILRIGGGADFAFAAGPGDAPKRTIAATTAQEVQSSSPERLNRFQQNAVSLMFQTGAAKPGATAAEAGGPIRVKISGREVMIPVQDHCRELAGEIAAASARLADGAAGVRAEFALNVRSTEAVIRYVGKRLCAHYRTEVCLEPPAVAEAPGEDELVAVAVGAASGAPALAATDFDGRRYAVPAGDRNNARTLAQLKQLIALHNNANAAPETAAVTVVGTGSLRGGR